jgi:hypothetical protein
MSAQPSTVTASTTQGGQLNNTYLIKLVKYHARLLVLLNSLQHIIPHRVNYSVQYSCWSPRVGPSSWQTSPSVSWGEAWGMASRGEWQTSRMEADHQHPNTHIHTHTPISTRTYAEERLAARIPEPSLLCLCARREAVQARQRVSTPSEASQALSQPSIQEQTERTYEPPTAG